MTTTLPAESIRGAIAYYYLVAFCPPDRISEIKKASRRKRKHLAGMAGISMGEFTKHAVPEVSRRIVSFHENTRRPDSKLVKSLTAKMRRSDSNTEKAAAFQLMMGTVAQIPNHAEAGKRLHHKKGCSLCMAPCRYGFFSLISDPAFAPLRQMLESENSKPPAERDAVNVLWTFSTGHLWRTLGRSRGFISVDHLANMSFCLLLLATARSRLALPEGQLKIFQSANQAMIRTWRPAEINLVKTT